MLPRLAAPLFGDAGATGSKMEGTLLMRRLVVPTAVFVAFALLLAASTSAQPRGSRILSVTYPSGNPGLIDVEITDVEYDVRSRTVSVTAVVDCNAPFVSVLWVDYQVSQTRGHTTTEGFASTNSNPCDEPVRAVIEPQPGGRFLPGRATIEVSTFACGRGCAGETVRAEVLLIPEPAAR